MPNIDHDEVTRVMSAQGGYGKGISPNPYIFQEKEWERRRRLWPITLKLSHKIESLFEPRFITPPPTAEFIEALIIMTDARRVLELGMHVGFTSLHLLRALVGKEGAKLTSVDARPAHDREFFTQPDLQPWFEFLEGWTPQILETLKGQWFDLLFIDSDHSVEHSEKERMALVEITKPGSIWVFHDCPQWQTPDNPTPHPICGWLDNLVKTGFFKGMILPTCEQLDGLATWGPGYPKQCNPHLGVFIRQ